MRLLPSYVSMLMLTYIGADTGNTNSECEARKALAALGLMDCPLGGGEWIVTQKGMAWVEAACRTSMPTEKTIWVVENAPEAAQ